MKIATVISSLYLLLVTALIAGRVARQERISSDTVMGGLCVYIMLGVLWTSLFVNLELFHPGSFNFGVHGRDPDLIGFYGLLFYYSFISLLSIGFGDVVPMSAMAQTLTNLEGLIGRSYQVFHIAYLIHLHISRRREGDSVSEETDN